ncbi:MAG: nucleotide exchange factor GrpE [Candidatus Moraniibacteriota bacterium]
MSKENKQPSKRPYEMFQLSQKVILYDPAEKKFLLLRDAFPDYDFHKKYGPWDLPGGRVHTDEDLAEALKRELQEEIGDDVTYELKQAISGQPIDLFSTGNDQVISHRVMLMTLAIYTGGTPRLSEEHDQLEWKTADEVESDAVYKPWLKEAIRSATIHIKAQEGTNDTMRVLADFENYKKRQQESQKELGGYLIEKLVLDIIPVLDNFRSATMHVPPEQKESPWVVGIQYIEKQLETVLTENGVTLIDAEPGTLFDPSLHEAVGTEGEEENSEQHKIAKVLQKGYKVGNKVIRAARVSVK